MINDIYFFIYNLFFLINYFNKLNNKNKFFWGLGIGDWGLGIGDWGLGAIPHTHKPNPQHPNPPRKIF